MQMLSPFAIDLLQKLKTGLKLKWPRSWVIQKDCVSKFTNVTSLKFC